MKGMKGKLLKKLKAIKPIAYNLKPDTILMVNAADGLFEAFTKSQPNKDVKEAQFVSEEFEEEKNNKTFGEPDVNNVAELMKDLEEDEMEVKFDDDKENVGPVMKKKDSFSCKENVGVVKKSENGLCTETKPLREIDVCSFRRPDINSGSLFDPNLLAAFEEAVNVHIRMSQEERKARMEQENIEKMRVEEEGEERKSSTEQENLELEQLQEGPPHKTRRIEEEEKVEEEEEDENPLLAFEEKCPPGGDESVILYTTTLRGIRKTFEDCNSIRYLLETFRISYYERDVSMHTEFREELWRIFDYKALPPRLFIKGRYIGGAAEVLVLHEQGKLRPLFEGIPIDESNGPCKTCAGVRFVLCFKCSGSHKVVDDEGLSNECQECNKNGLIICPICC